MIAKDRYLLIAQKYGHYASWAIWGADGDKPKSNMGDISIFNLDCNPKILEIVKTNVIMVGLNISRKVENVFGNFHDSRPQAQDYKIRYAFKNTQFYGAYMTDIIKDFEQCISGKVISYCNKNKGFVEQNISLFQQELVDIGSVNPIIFAFGNHTYTILNRYLKNTYQIVKLPHYSNYIGKENYKEKIDKIIDTISPKTQ